MGTYSPNSETKVIALQYLESKSTLDKVNLHDWIHGTDSSTIYGPASDFIMKDIANAGGMPIPYKDTNGEYYPNKYLAISGDWIIKHGELNFTVMSDTAFKDLFSLA